MKKFLFAILMGAILFCSCNPDTTVTNNTNEVRFSGYKVAIVDNVANNYPGSYISFQVYDNSTHEQIAKKCSITVCPNKNGEAGPGSIMPSIAYVDSVELCRVPYTDDEGYISVVFPDNYGADTLRVGHGEEVRNDGQRHRTMTLSHK